MAKTLDALEKDDDLNEELSDEIFDEENEEELFADEDELLRGEELPAVTAITLLDALEELATAPVLTVTLDMLTLLVPTELVELDVVETLLEAVSELELLEELLEGLEETGVGVNPVLLVVTALLAPPPPPHAVKITDIVKAEAIPPKRADKVFIAFLCRCRSGYLAY